jgi:hypothetical protein
MPPGYTGPDMFFLIGGYNEGEAYGRVYEVAIPHRPRPQEQTHGTFGVTWGGQKEFIDRLLQGFDDNLPAFVQRTLGLSDTQRESLRNDLKNNLPLPIPYQFLSLQDCVDVAIFLLRTTITLQKWIVGIRGVGGAIDVATITRTDGFRAVQQKTIAGERS